MNWSEVRGTHRGILLALGTAAISGVSVYLNSFAVKLVPDAAVYTTAKNTVAAVVLVALALALGARREAVTLDRRRGLGLLAIGVIGGSIPFLLFFSGLAIATAPTAAFIHKTMFIWVAFMAVPLLHERLGIAQVIAIGLLLGGQLLVAPPTGMGWGPGETMIAAATLLWSVEVVVAKRLLGSVSPSLLAASRMGIGVVILVGYLVATGRVTAFATIGTTAWVWILVTGLLLSGYVATWYGALRLAPATTVTTVLVGGALVTAALSAATNGTAPSGVVLAGYLLLLAGVTSAALLTSTPGPTTGRRSHVFRA
jgi:drug/metabolite transporter (DMT)-like permease